MCSRPPPATSNSRQAASSSPAPTVRSAFWSWRRACAAASSCRRACRNSLDVDHVVTSPCPPPSRTAVTSPRSKSIPRPAPRTWCDTPRSTIFGTIVNPLLVEGQIQGGVVQGLGQVLLEQAVYDADGQLVTGSFMDYAMPRAHDAPMINVVSHPVPTKSNPLGAKGCGEAGTSGGLPSVANAVIDALSEYGIRHWKCR